MAQYPLGGYTDQLLGGLGWAAGWSGDSGGWRGAVFKLADLVEGLEDFDLQFRFVFGSDGNVTDSDFWIDDIAITTRATTVAVPEELPSVVLAPTLSAYPNPFNPQLTIAWSAPRTGHLRLEVFDLRGRRVRTLLDGEVSATAGEIVWNGRDLRGRGVASGAYLLRLQTPEGPAVVERIVLAR